LAPIENQLKEIRLFLLDFDGVFTDNRVIIGEDGKEMVICDRSDSLGLKMLREKRPDITIMVISKETNNVVAARCKKLQIECRTGIDNKLETVRQILSMTGLTARQIIFMGNDMNDLECIRFAGIGIAVADANDHVLAAADYVTTKNGGRGAIREVTDMILHLNQITPM